MKSAYLLPLLFAAPFLQASEEAMQNALSQWERQMTEYRAALDVAATPEQRASIIPPRGADVAAKLWKAVSAKTGSRQVTMPDKSVRKVSVYEFEQPWAAPAVAWFLCHPNEFAEVLADKPRQQSFFAEALLDSVDRVHYSNPAIEPGCAALINGSTRKTYNLLVKIFNKNPEPSAKASAALALCILLGNPLIAGEEGNATAARNKRIYYLKQAADLAPEGATFGNVTFEDAISEIAYMLRNLSIGSIPPQMQLTDTKGQPITLPQPGKTHLLYFWAPTDDNALMAVSHMESVKDSYPDLAICPITAYREDENWAETLERFSISTCYMDDEQASAATAYRITSVPTAVLVDEHCRILYIGTPGLELQTAILKLMEAKKAAATPAPKAEGKKEAPIIQPRRKPQPTPAPQPEATPDADTPPPLRDMPEF